MVSNRVTFDDISATITVRTTYQYKCEACGVVETSDVAYVDIVFKVRKHFEEAHGIIFDSPKYTTKKEPS